VDHRTGLPVVGMVGAGQLARMTHQAAIALGQSLRVLADSPDDGAALVAQDVVIGDYRELSALQSFAEGCDVVTFDHEHVPQPHLRALASAGVKLAPGPDALRFAQDKAAMRARLSDLGIAVPTWRIVRDEAELNDFADGPGWPLVIKAATGGYDGRGVWVVDSIAEARPVLAELTARGTEVLAEARVDIRRELAAVVARSPFGQGAAWPVVETVQRDGICVEVLAPAPDLDPDQADIAQQLALRLAGELGVVGVLAVELFEDQDGRLLVNELAMRPHNSAHWTIEGSRTSQFEQHLRAVLDYPLGSTELRAPSVVMANLLGADGDVSPKGIDERVHHFMASWPDVKLHLYGKALRPGRKVGHVTALGDDPATTRARARAAADYLMYGADYRTGSSVSSGK
jgi:5-(carboxyamino)imidazole ribonucleotide synthase